MHDAIPLWNGKDFVPYQITKDLKLALNTPAAAGLYDIWAVLKDGAPALFRGPVWTTTSARSNDIPTRRNGRLIRVNGTGGVGYVDKRFLYLGTVYTNASGQTSDASTGRYVWNFYNKIRRTLRQRSNSGHTATFSGWRPFNNDAAGAATTSAYFVVGWPGDAISFWGWGDYNPTGNIGVHAWLDSSGAPNPMYIGPVSSSNWEIGSTANLAFPAAGLHYIQSYEYGDGSSRSYNYGDASALIWT